MIDLIKRHAVCHKAQSLLGYTRNTGFMASQLKLIFNCGEVSYSSILRSLSSRVLCISLVLENYLYHAGYH